MSITLKYDPKKLRIIMDNKTNPLLLKNVCKLE